MNQVSVRDLLQASAANNKPKATMPYGVLRQRNDDYDGELFDEIEDFYKGGYTIAKRAKKYLPRLWNENDACYKERCATTSYIAYFAQIVNNFASDTFSQELTVTPAADAKDKNTPGTFPDENYYTGFAKKADLKDRPFVEVMRSLLTSALKFRCALLAVDAPQDPVGPVPLNRAQEDAGGTNKFYVYEIHPAQLIDWDKDPSGDFTWCVLANREKKRDSPLARRDIITETFTVWTMADDGTAYWQRYVIKYRKGDTPRDDVAVPLDDDGATSFKRIPILQFELPDGLWLGNLVGTQAKEHYQRRSALVSAENRSLVAIPVANLASEFGATESDMPSEAQQDPNRGKDPVGKMRAKGFVCIGQQDKISFAEPAGACYELTDKQLDNLKDAMFQVTNQMAASVKPTPSALGRSGLSKQEDGSKTAIVLRALGNETRKFSVKTYDTISTARGEDVVWEPHGLDSYEINDRESVLEEAISVDQVAIPSPTFKKLHKFRLAKKLLESADPQVLAVIQQEIEDGVENEQELKDITVDAQKDAILNPPPPTPPKPGQPAVKSPVAPPPKAPVVK